MLIIQSGQDVYGRDPNGKKFVKLPLTYIEYGTEPTPESLNKSIEWLLDFFKRNSLPYTVLIREEESKGPTEKTEIVYADIVSGSTVKHSLALYTVATSITTGATKSLETTLLGELT